MEKEYNLNVVKEVKVTEAFLGLGKEVIKCQNDETYDDCRTRQYFDAIKGVYHSVLEEQMRYEGSIK